MQADIFELKKKVFFLPRTFILLDIFCSLIILVFSFFNCVKTSVLIVFYVKDRLNLFNIRQIDIKSEKFHSKN